MISSSAYVPIVAGNLSFSRKLNNLDFRERKMPYVLFITNIPLDNTLRKDNKGSKYWFCPKKETTVIVSTLINMPVRGVFFLHNLTYHRFCVNHLLPPSTSHERSLIKMTTITERLSLPNRG